VIGTKCHKRAVRERVAGIRSVATYSYGNYCPVIRVYSYSTAKAYAALSPFNARPMWPKSNSRRANMPFSSKTHAGVPRLSMLVQSLIRIPEWPQVALSVSVSAAVAFALATSSTKLVMSAIGTSKEKHTSCWEDWRLATAN
jgi:hypothetical protein